MLRISLYHLFCVSLLEAIKAYSYRKNQSYTTDRQRTSAIRGWFSQWQKSCILNALPCKSPEIKRIKAKRSLGSDRNDTYICELIDQKIRSGRYIRTGNTSWSWSLVNHGLFRRGSCLQSLRIGQEKRDERQGSEAIGFRQEGKRKYVQDFFISIGARYRRIRKRPKGKPLPQLYACKTEELQDLEFQLEGRLIDLHFSKGRHISTEGYVPYGWQFCGEDVFILSQRGYRFNIFGIIDRNNRYEGFSSNESITVDKVADSLDRLSFCIKKNTFVILNCANIYRGKLFTELSQIREKWGFFSSFCLYIPYT